MLQAQNRRSLLTVVFLLSVGTNLFGQEPAREDLPGQLARAFALNNQEKFADAIGLYEKLEPLAEKLHGKESVELALVLNNWAFTCRNAGQWAKAETLYQRSLEIREGKLGKEHPEVANSLNNLADLYRQMGLYGPAEPLLVRSLQIYQKLDREIESVPTLTNLAELYKNLGKFAKAESIFRSAVRIREQKLDANHPKLALSLFHLARFHASLGEFASAEPLYVRCQQIWETNKAPEAAYAHIGRADLYAKTDKKDQAEALFRRGCDLLEKTRGEKHADLAFALNNFGGFYDALGKHADAEKLYQRSLAIYEANLGEKHPHIAIALSNLAGVYDARGEYKKAEPLYRRTLEINEATLGSEHPHTAKARHNVARNAASQGQWQKAVEYFHAGRQGTARHLAELLPALSEREQLNFLQANFESGFHRVLSLGWSARAEAGGSSAEWLLNGKAVAHQCLAEQHLLAREAKDPKARQTVEALQRTRARLAAMINLLPRPGLETEYQKEIQQLRTEETDLAQQLARTVGRPHRADPWLRLEQLRAKLAGQSVFVDIARFAVFDFAKGKKLPAHYVAWITPPADKGDVQIIDLGAAEPIDQLVERTRNALLDSARSLADVGEIEALDMLQKPLQALSARVLHPLLPAIEKYDDWIICPDGALWLTPWNALVLPGGKFAVEKYQIRHVVSGRDLVLEFPHGKTKSAHVFADPDYDITPGKAKAASRKQEINVLGQRLRGAVGAWKVSFEFRTDEVVIYDEDAGGQIAGKGSWQQKGNRLTIETKLAVFQGTFDGVKIRGQRTYRDGSGTENFHIEREPEAADGPRVTGALGTLPKAPRLPGTAVEAEAMRAKLKSWLGQEPKIYLDAEASESTLKNIASPRVLILATHGYFLPKPDVEKKGRVMEHPLTRCGLLLAACNRRAEAKPGEDDGILSGLEIIGLNLTGCELVVLSACETGLGDVRNGEGVAGMRQAFQLAGAQNVLASLWQVPDRETARLMSTFYDELAKGKNHAVALRQAQLERIAARRAQFGAAHPFFWSAFALTGRGGD